MKLSKRFAIGFVILLAVLAIAGCPSTNQRQQVAQAAQDASIVVKGFQQSEIAAYQQGQIPAADHAFVQNALITISTAGKTTDSCIKSTTDTAGIVGCVNVAIATVDQLNTAGALGLKSDKAKTDFSLAMIGTRTALAVIATILGGQPAPVAIAPASMIVPTSASVTIRCIEGCK